MHRVFKPVLFFYIFGPTARKFTSNLEKNNNFRENQINLPISTDWTMIHNCSWDKQDFSKVVPSNLSKSIRWNDLGPNEVGGLQVDQIWELVNVWFCKWNNENILRIIFHPEKFLESAMLFRFGFQNFLNQIWDWNPQNPRDEKN